MCFDHDSRPPIAPIAGGALDATDIVLEASDGNRFGGYLARAAEPTGAGVVILPDVRGLHPYYKDLALRFAEHGIDAIAFDYFGRTAGIGERGVAFDHQPHVAQITWAGVQADVAAAAAKLRAEADPKRLYTTGFCMGGRLTFDTASLGLGLAGAIGFYGFPVGESRGIPAPADLARQFECPILGIFGGADQAISREAIASFETALNVAGVEHRITVYPNAPHSFFDRKADEFASTSQKAWDEVLAFIGGHAAA
jgi:carboxymethylenebutenolidase